MPTFSYLPLQSKKKVAVVDKKIGISLSVANLKTAEAAEPKRCALFYNLATV